MKKLLLFRHPAVLLVFLMLPAMDSRGDLTSGVIRFVDIAARAGVNFLHVSGDPKKKNLIIEAKGGGLALLDADGDGWLDLYFVNGSTMKPPAGDPPKDRLYRNNRDGTFTDVTDASGLGDTEWGMGCAAADYDNDGDVDLYVTNKGPNRLYQNDGKGHFTDVMDHAGCQSLSYSTGVSFADYDRDGLVDVVVADYLDLKSLPESAKAEWRGFAVYPGPRAYNPLKMYLFHNKGDGTFEDVTQKSGIGQAPPAYHFTCLWADVDEDQYPDLYVANDSMPGYLFMNQRDGTFAENGLLAGVSYSEDGTEMAFMGAAFGDPNGDGHWDLSVTTFSEEPFPLWFGSGDGTFTDVTYARGIGNQTYSSLGWGVQWIDVENDGDEDLFFCNGHVYPEADHPDLDTSFAQKAQLFENVKDGKFVCAETGLGDDFYIPRVGRGCASGDLDNDGDLDLVLTCLNGHPAILRNDGGNANHWLQLSLEGTRSNRMAIGAVAKLQSGSLIQMREVRSQSSFLSQNSPVLHFGLGPNPQAERIEIQWPSGSKTVLENVKADQRLFIREDAKEPLQ
ncbi:MAG: CRTAC1 family protein [bacterium]